MHKMEDPGPIEQVLLTVLIAALLGYVLYTALRMEPKAIEALHYGHVKNSTQPFYIREYYTTKRGRQWTRQ